jgi:hypothetical protein
LLKKQQDIRNVSQKSPKDSKPQCVQHQKSQLPSIYTDFHTLDHEQLKLIVANEELRKLTPLNSRGKYHIQKISNRYPIAGTQV